MSLDDNSSQDWGTLQEPLEFCFLAGRVRSSVFNCVAGKGGRK